MDVQDRLDIADTLGRLNHLIDRGELDRLDMVFTADAVYDMSAARLPVMQGVAAIRAGALRLGDENPLAHHATDSVLADDSGDEATVQSKGLMLTVQGTLRSVTYLDVFRRTAQGWRIARRTITPQHAPLGGLLRSNVPE